jgi:hypothetical protein
LADDNAMRWLLMLVGALVPLPVIVGVSRSASGHAGTQAAPRVQVEWSERVSSDAVSAMHVETWLAVNPADARHFIATAMVPQNSGSVVYVSRDGGRKWSRGVEAGTRTRVFPERVFPDMDPVVEFAPDGTPYFATLADGFTIWRGEDGGSSWTRLGIVPGGTYDRQWIGFDASGGEHHGRIYTAGKVPIQVLGSPARDVAAFSWSDDRGSTFRQARLVMPNPAEGGLNVLSHMIVLPSGALVAAYQFFRWSQLGRNGVIEGEMQTLLSRDARSWDGPFTAGSLRVFGNGAQESMMIKGLGGGRLAAAPAGNGRIYLTWTNEVEGFLQVLLASSSDGGRTWSEPVRVNDGGYTSNHSNPALAVNSSGHVAITWNDRRDDPADRCFRPYVTVSMDQARSFLPAIPLAATPVCPPAGRWLNGGDTQGLVALPDGSFQAVWIGAGDARNAALQLWTSRIAVRSGDTPR